MADKTAEKTKKLFETVSKTENRSQWEYINQKGYDFAHDNQLTDMEKKALEDQGMPTFTINRIMPVVDMLNFYATANAPRWQAVGAEGSDSEVAAVFSDIADYIWHNSSGNVLIGNAINDAITKSVGYIVVTKDSDSDNGMGDVIIQQPDPFDVFVDPKSRDILFRDASFIMIRKIMKKGHLKSIFPDMKRKINSASGNHYTEDAYTEKTFDNDRKDFHYKDISSIGFDKMDDMIEYYENYEAVKVPFMNVVYQIPPNPEQIREISARVKEIMLDTKREMDVELEEQEIQMSEALEQGNITRARYELEMDKTKKEMAQQLESMQREYMSEFQAQITQVENKLVSEKEYNILMANNEFKKNVVDAVRFHKQRIKLTCVVGDKTLYSKILPLEQYPIIPLHYKWTGTPYPISAVSPLIGKQRELNKAHQLMVHNASLGSSLRWTYEEGAIDTDYWESYSAAPGALLPRRPGFEDPKPVLPFQLNNAFYSIVQEGKGDMEYLAGIYAAMQGDTQATGDMPYRGMLAMDEYGTRRVKQWMKNSIEPALTQIGEVIKEYSQVVYTAEKVFRIVQPSALQEERDLKINVPIFNDFGEAIGKWRDYPSAKFDVRIIGGSTLPVNRWAYLEELKELMKLGVVDDIAVLSETDVKNKHLIAQRKSLYSQLQQQVSSLEETLKDKEGAIETLERQLVQAGIKNKIMQGTVEVNKKVHDSKSTIHKEELETKAQQKFLRDSLKQKADTMKKEADIMKNGLQKTTQQ